MSEQVFTGRIRRAGPADAAALARLRAALMSANSGDAGAGEPADFVRRTTEFFRAQLAGDGDVAAWVAELDDLVVGSAAVTLFVSPPRRGSKDSVRGVPLDARIRSVFVDERYRRRGIARRLLTDAIEHARALGCHRISLGSSPMAVPMYERLGFTRLAREFQLEL